MDGDEFNEAEDEMNIPNIAPYHINVLTNNSGPNGIHYEIASPVYSNHNITTPTYLLQPPPPSSSATYHRTDRDATLTAVSFRGTGPSHGVVTTAAAAASNLRGVSTPHGVKFLTFQSSLAPCHEEDLTINTDQQPHHYYTTPRIDM